MRDLRFDPRERSGYRLRVIKKALILVALVLAGCEDSQREGDDVFALYRGKPIETVMARWGAPQSARRLTDGTIYYWSSDMQYQPISPQTSTGYIGTTPFVVNTPAPPTTLTCRQEVHADLNGHIQYIGGHGNNGACVAMLRRLK